MSAALPAGATIGIVGGGQLGRMLAMAAAVLALSDGALAERLDAYRARQSAGIAERPNRNDA